MSDGFVVSKTRMNIQPTRETGTNIKSLLVKDIMTYHEVIVASPFMSMREVAELLLKNDIHGVPVIDSSRKVIGIITETDFFVKDRIALHLPSFVDVLERSLLMKGMGEKDKTIIKRLIETVAKDIMTPDPICIQPETPIRELFDIFSEKRIKTVPVTNDGGILVGIVSLADAVNIMRICFSAN